jgi:CO/xanthine dehydrogenase FAD-binding subunit
MSFGSPYLTLPDFEYHRPATLEEALELLSKHGEEAKVMAGGVGLLAFMKERLMSPAHVVDIKGIKQLGTMKHVPGKYLRIGASVTLAEVSSSEVVSSRYTALHEAASMAADPMIRGRATLVGNVCEAIPWVDTPPALIALGASVEVAGAAGRRSVEVERFIRGPVDVDLKPDEIVTGVELPDVPGRRSAFEKFSAGTEFSIASVAASVIPGRKDGVRIVYGAVSSTPVRCTEAERIVAEGELSRATISRAAQAASESVECVTDVLSSAEYRRHLIRLITMKVLRRLFVS